jgi:hypothetical protein
MRDYSNWSGQRRHHDQGKIRGPGLKESQHSSLNRSKTSARDIQQIAQYNHTEQNKKRAARSRHLHV